MEYDLLAAASALMATYFGILHRTTEWLAQNGLPGLRLSRAPVCRLSEAAIHAGKDVDFVA